MRSRLRRALGGVRKKALATGAGQYLARRQRHLNALAYRRTRQAVARRTDAEERVEDVLDTVLDERPGWYPYAIFALQLREEFEDFVRFVESRAPRTVLETGTFQGGSLYVWARALDSTRQVVSVDRATDQGLTDRGNERQRDLLESVADDTRIDVVYGDSHDERTSAEVESVTEGDVDLLFVDGDHTYEGVAEDFETYRRLVGDGGLVAFHDIRRHAEDESEKRARLARADDVEERHVTVGRPEWGVSEFWSEVRTEYDSREFLTHPEQMGKGIGVIEL